VHISEVATAAAITVSVAGLSYVAFNPAVLTDRAETVADQATCRAVDQAIVAYGAVNETAARSIGDLEPYVNGDISRYRILRGAAAGPGCATA
jgi:hypothetical protein